MEIPDIEIESLRARHIESVVQVHLEAFPGFFLSFLGAAFIREFYGAFLADANSIAFIAETKNGQIVGVVAGSVAPRRFYSRLVRRRWHAFALASLGALIRKPSIALRLARAFWYRGDTPYCGNYALLSSVAVKPDLQGCGIGRKLVQNWLDAVRRSAVDGAYLTTDAEGNDTVNAFYGRMGWRLDTVYVTPEARRLNRYVINWNQTECTCR